MSDDSKKTDANIPPTTLDQNDITVDREVGRRSVLTAIGASVLGAVAQACGPRYPRQRYPVGYQAGYVQQTGINDADPQDPVGGGRGQQGVYVQQQPGAVYVQPQQPVVVVQQPGMQTGLTDGDSGAYADPAGRGRGGNPRQTGLTDGDAGPYADPAGGGRGTYRSGWGGNVTDGDSGAYADPAGRGRGRSGLTDSDSGPYADPAGRGRGGVRVQGGGGPPTGLNDSDPSDPAGHGRFGR